MSLQPVPHRVGRVPMDRRELLFTPGPRLGWVFRDRRQLALPYPEPEPSQQVIQARTGERAAASEQALARAWRWVGKPSMVLAVILVTLAGCAKSLSGSFDLGLTAITVFVLCGPGLGYTGWCWMCREQARDLTPEQEYRQTQADWNQRAAEHEASELARLANQVEWGSVTCPSQQTDIFGGTLAGWQALLTVHGTSILAERQLLAVDLTGQQATAMLTAAAQRGQVESATYHLPYDLGRCGLLAELSPAQLADAIAEAMHADAPGGARADRAVDVRIVHQLAGALGHDRATPQRLGAAVRAAFGSPVPDGLLSAAEKEHIAGDLFPPGYRQQVTPNLIRLDAVLGELAAYAAEGWPARQARYTCLTVETAARSASGEILSLLIMQWLTMQVAASAGSAPAVIVVGADEITRPYLERLASTCEHRGVPLTLMFRHLREHTAAVLGSGTAAFMRLANHAEAEQAASYIGRRHTFVVSSFTATSGGNQTSTQGGGDSYGINDSHGDARTRSWQSDGIFGGRPSSGLTRTTGTGSSRNWSTSWSRADGTNWSGAQTRQRTYEYAVEPATLQNMPDYALLLADRSGTTLQLHAVECDPAIITLPGASTAPLPPPGSHGYGPAAQYGNASSSAPLMNYPDPAIAVGQDQTAWADPDDPEPEPAWPGEQPGLSWWKPNQPPDYRP